ncbi:MAG TPA: hypothetical protein VE172_15945 [Stackebrandtia sp.]|jgi:hypothetical protein|uniref:hypothetical protein n=1 Tax=Stackebrandtia sp. TaxID=2023065 RepID=UPI002D29CFF2|nr:hypothetical protein [Stackebrandtia sp.]HZE40297.1 hypothetical protein [Stackebrandtia sp.]
MTAIDRAAERLLRLAARRWPAAVRDERYREWAAELGYLRSDADLPRSTRAVTQLRYALSLAASPPVNDEGRVPHGWRELLPRMGRRLWPVVALLGLGMAFRLLAGLIPGVVFAAALGGAKGLSLIYASPSTMIASGFILLGSVALACWLGVLIGRRLPMIPSSGGHTGSAASVAVAMTALGAGVLAVDTALEADQPQGFVGFLPGAWLFTPVVWVVAFTPVVWIAVELTRRRGAAAGRIGGALLGLVALDITAIPTQWIASSAHGIKLDPADAFKWFFVTVLSTPSWDVAMVAPISVVSAFALCYATTACRVPAREPAVRVPSAAPDRVFSRPRAVFGLCCAGLGVAVWAVSLADATPAGIALAHDIDAFVMWALELRLAAILVAALGLGLALVGRGRPVTAAVTAGLLLLGADTMLDLLDRTGSRGLVVGLAVGAMVLTVVWRLGRVLLISRPDGIQTRRVYIGISVAAAACAPVILVQSTSPVHLATPPVFPACSAAVAALLAAIATVAALAARPAPAPGRSAAMLVAAPVASLALAGSLSGMPFNTVFHLFGIGMLGGFVCLPFAVYAVAIIAWHRARRRARATAIWLLVGLASVVLDAVALMVSMSTVSNLVAVALLRLQGESPPSEGTAVLPGMLVIAIVGGVVAAHQLVPAPQPRKPTAATGTRAVNPV